MMVFKTSELGCIEFEVASFADSRGTFSKFYSRSQFVDAGISWNIQEVVFSSSKEGVLRGLHFQIPPFSQSKIVTCLEGEIFEVVVDLRKNSKTMGRHEVFELSAKNHKALIIPEGFAQGFLVLSGSARVSYALSNEFKPEADMGILWNSVGISWPNQHPTLSEKDSRWPAFKDFDSPF